MHHRVEKVTDLIFQLKLKCINNELKIMEEYNLIRSEYNAIASMNSEEVVCSNDLSIKMCLSPSRASRVIEKMVKKGLLIRDCNPEDRRKCEISLSKRGITIRERIEEKKVIYEKKICERFTEQEIKNLKGCLNKIIKTSI